MENIIYKTKEQQQIRPLFGGKFIENKPIPFPEMGKKYNYSNLFYWAHLEANDTTAFPLHPHEGFEIMTFILKGSLEHFDTATNVWTPIQEGGFQVIQSNSGVSHSEKIIKGSKVFQIWFDPDFSKTLKLPAGYTDYSVDFIKPKKEDNKIVFEYIGDSKVEHQTEDISIRKEVFFKGRHNYKLDKKYIYSIYVILGEGSLDSQVLNTDDYLICKDIDILKIDVSEKLELFIVKTPKELSYKTYI